MDQLDAHWNAQLTTVDKTELDAIFAGMRCKFPLVLSARDTKCCALIPDPDPSFPQPTSSSSGHQKIMKDTYNRGAIKIDDKVNSLLV